MQLARIMQVSNINRFIVVSFCCRKPAVVSIGCLFFTITPAGFRSSVSEVAGQHIRFVSTIAFGKPYGIPVFVHADKADGGQPTEAVARQVIVPGLSAGVKNRHHFAVAAPVPERLRVSPASAVRQ